MHPTPEQAFAGLRASLGEEELRIVTVMEGVRSEYLPSGWDLDLERAFKALLRTVATRHRTGAGEDTPRRRETRALVVVGEAGTGKTASLDNLFRGHPSLPGYGDTGSGCPLVTVSVPSPCTLKTLGIRVLRALGFPLARDMAEHLVWNRVYQQLPVAGAFILHFDEMHNLTDGANVVEIDKIRKTLKSLMASDAWPLGLVISGKPGITPDLQVIDEIRRRGRFVRVPLLDASADLAGVEDVLARLAKAAGVAVPEGLAKAVAPRLVHAALRRFGILVELIHEAIEVTLADDVPFDADAFATAYFDRTGVGDLLNPFVAVDWASVDCALVLLDEAPPEEPVLPDDPKRRARPRKKGAKRGRGGK